MSINSILPQKTLVQFLQSTDGSRVLTTTIAIMYHPLPSPHRKGVILSDLQIIHHLGARDNLPAGHHTVGPIGAQHMHAQRDLSNRQEALLLRQEGMLFVGVDRLTRPGGGFAMPSRCGRGQGQVHQVIVMVDPHVQDRFLFHLVRLRVVGPYLLAHAQRADGLLAFRGCYQGGRRKTQRPASQICSPLFHVTTRACISQVLPSCIRGQYTLARPRFPILIWPSTRPELVAERKLPRQAYHSPIQQVESVKYPKICTEALARSNRSTGADAADLKPVTRSRCDHRVLHRNWSIGDKSLRGSSIRPVSRIPAVDKSVSVIRLPSLDRICLPPLCIVGGPGIIGLSAWACNVAPCRITLRLGVAIDIGLGVHPSQVPIGGIRRQEH